MKHSIASWQYSKKWGYIAAFAMLPYAMLKTIWAFEVNIGISSKMLTELHTNMTTYSGTVISFLYRSGIDITSVLGIIASLLGLALVQSWGQTLPSWVPYFRGRSVPRWLLLTPAWLGGIFFAIQFAIVMFQIIFQMIALDSIQLDSWVFYLVYGGFFLWGLFICLAARSYQIRTRNCQDRK